MEFSFSVVHPATGQHAWDITEGWSAALREKGLLCREFRPKADWGCQHVDHDDGLLDYLKSDPQEHILLLGYDWHSQPLHYGEIHDLLRLRRRKNIAVIWEDYQVKEEWLDGLAEKMRRAWMRCKSAFKLAISNHENNIQALAGISGDVLIHYIGFGVDDTRFEAATHDKDAKINRVYFSGKIADWSNDTGGGPYAQRRKIIHYLEQTTINLVSIQGRQSDSEYTQNLLQSTICLNLPSFSLSPTLRNYEALAAKSLLVTWKSDSLKSVEELKKFPNVFFYDPTNLDGVAQICSDLLRVEPSEYQRLTSLGSQQLYRLTHKARIQQLIDLLEQDFHRKVTVGEQRRVLVIDMVFLQVARNGIAYVWDSIIKSYIQKHGSSSLILIQRTDELLSDYGCRVIKVHPVDWKQDPVDLSGDIDRLLNEHGVNECYFASSYYTFSADNPSLQIIHDMIPEILGGTEPVWAHKRASLNRSSTLLCVSRSTRNDLLGYNRGLADKAQVHLNGVPVNHYHTSLHPSQRLSTAKEQLIASDFTMITIGGRYGWKGYKNCGVVFKAFKKFLERMPKGSTSKIICISHSNTPEPQIQGLIRDLPVYFTGADDGELALIRERAHCLLYPSAIEGFGLPILEALYSGMHVIASDILPHREAAGSFASKVRFALPFDVDSFADAMFDCFCQDIPASTQSNDPAFVRDQIHQASQERWMSFADALASFAHHSSSLRVKSPVCQNELWLSAMENSFLHKKNSLPVRIASSWNRPQL